MNIGIFGLGLIGGSIGMSIHKKTNHTVFGYDIDKDVTKAALLKNASDFELVESDIQKLDVVILAVFPHIATEILEKIIPNMKDGTIVCDVCGIKGDIISSFEKFKGEYPKIKFVGTHPMAGREYVGINYAISTLFDSAFAIITPVLHDIETAGIIEKLYLEIGFCGCVYASSEKHDEMIAYTSQLAHIVSSCFIKNPLSENHVGFSAGSFQDMTRVARLNPDMWTELFMQNIQPLHAHVDLLVEKLQEFSCALKDKNEKEIHALLSEGTKQKELADTNFQEYCKSIGRK